MYQSAQVWKLTLHVVISGFLFGYTLGVFNTCSANVSASLNWGDSKSLYTTLFSTIMPIGAFFGALLSAGLMNKYGRRKSTMFFFQIISTEISPY